MQTKTLGRLKIKWVVVCFSAILANAAALVQDGLAAPNEVMTWVPPYAIAECQAAAQADFGACDAKDGLTRVGLQFWTPNWDGTIKYADHEWYTPTDADVAWWRNWCSTNGIKCMLTIYNNTGSWDWNLARAAFASNETTFVAALVAEMDRLNLDGIDVDLEGIGDFESDRSDFDLFIHDLWAELDARGKILTIDSFHYIWNAPNQNWWSDWLGEVDNIHTMGYEDLYEGGTGYHKYSFQQNAGYSAGYAGNVVLMGMPSWLASWGTSSGRGTTALAHIREVRYDLTEPTGIAIWDLQLDAWQDSDLWCEIAALKGDGADITPPTPDPMTWETAPHLDAYWQDQGNLVISMTASTAADPSGGIEYYFELVSGGPGGEDSGWQTGTGFSDWWVENGYTYTYRVKARDAMGNETGWSADSLVAVGAQERYVSVSGNDANPGTLSSPWRTIQYAVDNVGPGDTIYVRSGTYTQQVVFNGVDDSGSSIGGYVMLRNFEGESPVIDGSGLTPVDREGLISILDAGYIKVIGFELKNFSTSSSGPTPVGIYIQGASHHIELRNNRIHDIEMLGAGGAHGIGVFGTDASTAVHELTIDGNEIFNCKLMWSEALVLNGNVRDFVVSNNSIHDCDNIAYDFIGFEGECSGCGTTDPDNLDQARDGQVLNNIAYNIDSKDNPVYSNERSADGFYVDGGKNIVFDGNTAHDCNLGFELASEHKGKSTENVTVRNSFVYHNHVLGIATGGYAKNKGNAENCTVVNNTFYKNNNSSRPEDDWGAEILLQYNNHNNIYKNNIVYARKGRPRVIEGGTTNTGNVFDYNLYFGSSAGTAPGANSFIADPFLINPDNGDLHISQNSSAINSGENLSDSVIGTVDIDGNNRNADGLVDIGAQEFTLVMDNPDLIEWGGSLVADFGSGRGIYRYTGDWDPLTSWGAVNRMLDWSSDLVVDVGDGSGMHTYNGSAWNSLTAWDAANNMLAWNGNLVVDFGGGKGIYTYNGTAWEKLTSWDTATAMTVWGTDLVIDFGTGRGLYRYNGSSWTKLTSWANTNHLIEWGGALVADFGTGRGIYTFNGTSWTRLTDWGAAVHMVDWGTNLAVDFGSNRGIFTYNGSTWNKLTTWDTANTMVAWGSNLAVDFGAGRGLLKYNGSSWTKITDWDDTAELLVVGPDLIVDFGPGRGIRSYNGVSWTPLTSWSTGD